MTELRIGDVISRSFEILFKNFAPFMLLTAIVRAPLIAALVFIGIGVDQGGAVFLTVTAGLGTYLLNTIASATVIYGVFQQLRGRHASMGACISVGLRRFVSVIGVGILSFLCMWLGFLALVIPGVILMLMLYVAVPVAVVEKPGVFEALKRSKELTDGYKMTILGILIVIGLIGFGTSFILGIFVEMLPGMAGVIVEQGIEICWGALSAVATGVIYHDLRVIKDGVNVEDLVRVFE